MPGLVVFKRRWSIGSDDLVVPAAFMIVVHLIWIIVLTTTLLVVNFDTDAICMKDLKGHVFGYLVILSVCLVVEGCIAWTSMRGSIINTEPRRYMQHFIYMRLVIFLVELAWLIVGVVWTAKHYQSCAPGSVNRIVLAVIICNWGIMLSVIIFVWCTFDTAGRKWVKMKRFQESLRRKRRDRKHSSCARRNWRQRKALRAYEEKWDKRFNLLCCCMERRGRDQSSISEVAQLFTEFFRELDVVPSDVVAGLLLLRRYQKLQMKNCVSQKTNDIYQYLSGAPITPKTHFLQLNDPNVMEEYKLIIHYMEYALAAYGWPAYMMMNNAIGLCSLIPYLSCCCCKHCFSSHQNYTTVIEDNCCDCNFAAMKQLSGLPEADIVYVTYHVDVGKTPFYVAIDHQQRKVVICIRGTLSLQDVLTDLKAESAMLPLDPPIENWLGHEGMVDAAQYIYKKLKEENILVKAFNSVLEQGISEYKLVLVGHSLGAGTAAILAILMKKEYPTLHCYAYSPPGGLISEECAEATKSYITSVIVGKDIVPRIGLSQLELLRSDLINVIKMNEKPKWKIIRQSMMCCLSDNPDPVLEGEIERNVRLHPIDSGIGLSAHKPLFLPGKIIHIVRSHPVIKKSKCKPNAPVYQAIIADNSNFEQVLVSPTMINDHFPDNVLDALQKVLINVAPAKPNRKLPETEHNSRLCEMPSLPVTDVCRHSCNSCVEKTFSAQTIQCIRTPSDPDLTLNPPPLTWDQVAEQNIRKLEYMRGINVRPPLTRCMHLNLTGQPMEAPLASPEPSISESSSAASLKAGAAVNRYSFHKAVHGFQDLKSIQQSPMPKLRTGALSCFRQEQSPTSDPSSDAEKDIATIFNEDNINNNSRKVNDKKRVAINGRVAHSLYTENDRICDKPNGHLSSWMKDDTQWKQKNMDEVSIDTYNRLSRKESEKNDSNFHLPHNRLGSSDRTRSVACMPLPLPKPLFQHSGSETILRNVTAAHFMRRSTEHMDLKNPKDDSHVFESSKKIAPVPKPPRHIPVRLPSSLPRVSVLSSAGEEFERRHSFPRL